MPTFLHQLQRLAHLREAKPRTLAERIKALRVEFGLSQAELAAIANVKPMTVSHWESGRNKKIDGRTMLKIALKLNVAARWIVGLTDDPTAFQSLSDDHLELVELFRTLSPENRANVLALVRSLALAAPSKPSPALPYPHVPRPPLSTSENNSD